MMNVLKYNLNTDTICADKVYDIEQVKLKINVGSSKLNNKSINLYYFPDDVIYEIKLNEKTDKLFDFNITENILRVTRIDKNEGWEENLSCDICISSKERIYLFRENNGLDKKLTSVFVTHHDIKVFDSHDINYVIHKNKK
jgi:hypothetical protein